MSTEPSLVEEYWLLTAGSLEVRTPTPGVRLGTAMAVLVDLGRRREVRWTSVGDEPAIDVVADCRCDGVWREWHDALSADFPSGVASARFALDPLVARAWTDTARLLVSGGRAREIPRRLGRSSFVVARPGDVQARRSEIAAELPHGDRVQDLPCRDLDLLTVATASGTVGDMLTRPGLEPTAPLRDSVLRAVEANPLLTLLEATVAFRGASTIDPTVGPVW